MEQAIAVEWGRFLRDLEAKKVEGLQENITEIPDGSTLPDPANAQSQGTKQAVWERLQDALAKPPQPEVPLFDDTPAHSVDLAQQEDSSPDQAFLEQFARTTTDGENRLGWLNTQPAAPALSESRPAAQSENGSYQMRSMWVGTGFEERRVLVTPPAPETSAPEREQPIAAENTSLQALLPAPNENLEENMWKSSYAEPSVSATAPANGTSLNTTQNQEGSRWFVLKGMMGGATAPQEPAGPAANVPVLEVFSLAGGVGKTSLVATLGRALSALGERVLLVEATPFGSLPYFFGACDCRPGAVRTFRPPVSSSDAPIRLVTIDSESQPAESAAPNSLATEIQGWARGAGRVIVDVATRSTATVRALSRMSPVVLVPLIPDVSSVVTANSIDSFFQRQMGAPSNLPDVYYLLNQFDPSSPLHLEVRKVLQDRLGERLLPFDLQRTPAVSEALAEGMTIVDYAPNSPMAEEILSLAKWLEDALAPADMNSGTGRWSER